MKKLRFIIAFICLVELVSIGSYGHSPLQDTILNRIDRATQLQGQDAEAALRMMQEALVLAKDRQEQYGELKANTAIGFYYYENHEYDKAIQYYQKNIKIVEKLDSLHLKGGTLMRIGNAYFRMGRFEVAKSNMETALSIFQQSRSKIDVVQALGNLGNIYMMLGQNDKALNSYMTAYKMAEELGSEDMRLGMELSISYYYLMNGLGKEALPYIIRSLKYHQKTGKTQQVAAGFGNLGYAYSLMGDYEKAFENYQHCVDTAQKYQFTRIEQDTYKDISETYKKNGNHEQAMDYLVKYYELRDSVIDKETQDKVSELQVQFETAEQQQEIEKLQQKQRIRNLQIGLLGIGLALLAMIAWFVIQRQRSNLLEKQAIIAKNEEIYRLEKALIEKELQQKQLEQEKVMAEANILKQQEAEARKYAEVLENSNKELETFAHVVSHDLREPLRMMSFYVQRIKRTLDNENLAKTKEYFDFAIDGAKRMDKMIKGILNIAQVQQKELKSEPAPLNEVAKIAVQNLREFIEEKNAKVQYDDLPTIKADQLQMIQLFQNLINNGLKFNTSDTPIVEISHKIVDKQIELSFKDNGIGIEEVYQNRIFKMFNRLEGHRFSGTGIGLATCQKIVERHNGTITVQSKPNKGTTFIVLLPLS